MAEISNIQGPRISWIQSAALTLLRLLIGGHLFYEGISKLLAADWTAGGYLARSNWFLADFYRSIAADPATLNIVDQLNIWGLILLGAALLLGFLPRLAGFFGAILLLMYWATFNPWYGPPYGGSMEGNYFIINMVLIEAVALLVLTIFPVGSTFRLDRMILALVRLFQPRDAASTSGHVAKDTSPSLGRRRVVGTLLSLPLIGAYFGGLFYRRHTDRESVQAITGATIRVPEAQLSSLKGQLPQGKLGQLNISRMFLGSNLIGGWSHARDLIYVSKLFKAYNTERKIFETFELAEQAGINMINLVCLPDNNQLAVLNKYHKLTGGKMQSMCQIIGRTMDDDLIKGIDFAIANGTTTLYIQGATTDRFVKGNRVDKLAEAVAYGREKGYVFGLGAHSIQSLIACEQAGIDADYYVKTLHHDRYWSAIPREQREEFSVDGQKNLDHDRFHDNIFDLFPEQTIDFMAKTNKPFVAFKVLAGGAIAPGKSDKVHSAGDGFRFAFENGADFICVGMFDFQIVEDVNIACDVLADLGKRQRSWMA